MDRTTIREDEVPDEFKDLAKAKQMELIGKIYMHICIDNTHTHTHIHTHSNYNAVTSSTFKCPSLFFLGQNRSMLVL